MTIVGKFLKLKNFEKYLRARREEVELCFCGISEKNSNLLIEKFLVQSEKKIV
jgi:hypothetical protein